MTIGALDYLHSISQPGCHDVDGLPRRNQIRRKGSPHIVDGADNSTQWYQRLLTLAYWSWTAAKANRSYVLKRVRH